MTCPVKLELLDGYMASSLRFITEFAPWASAGHQGLGIKASTADKYTA